MRDAQIRRLQALQLKMNSAWVSHDGGMDAEAVLVDVEELVDILLMEVEDHDTAGSEP